MSTWFQRLYRGLTRTRPPWSQEVQAFWERVAKSGLLDEDQLRKAYTEVRSNRTTEATLDDVCALLVSTDALTNWQCDKLRSGRWKGFFQEGHCVLCHVGKDDTSSTYLCREIESGKRVAMVVTLPMLTADGKLRYAYRELTDEEIAQFT